MSEIHHRNGLADKSHVQIMGNNITWLYILKNNEYGCLAYDPKFWHINLHFSFQNLEYVAAHKYICTDKSVNNVLLNPGYINPNAFGSSHTNNYCFLKYKIYRSCVSSANEPIT